MRHLLLALLLLAAPPASALRLVGPQALTLPPDAPTCVRLAARDVSRDYAAAAGAELNVVSNADGRIRVVIDKSLIPDPEAYRIVADPDRVTIAGADALGAVYGLYEFSRRYLGVDPYWFWKDLPPVRLDVVVIRQDQPVTSPKPAFRFRGWFVNDEDLLTEFKPPSGPRHIDYPFYHTVINLDLADRIFETALRAGANLIIPASFLDVMNDPEAALLRRAVDRGLFVTQHHIEPLGMSFFGFENYWKARGQKIPLAYGKDPATVHQTWRAYAKRWRDIAGDQVVWQVGLRGRGDRPLWSSDASVTEQQAGAIIASAMAEQVKIIREADPRPDAPITTTLWLEMSKLMSKGALKVPPGVALVFCDEGATQTLQDDFESTPRDPNTRRGIYYHIAFWKNGPHLLQGTRPAKLKAQFQRALDKGDTHYAIVNVSNIREHLLGIEAATSIMRGDGDWTPDQFLARFAPPKLAPLYAQYLAALADAPGNIVLQDGHCYTLGESLLDAIRKKQRNPPVRFFATRQTAIDTLTQSVARLDALIAAFDAAAADLPAPQRRFYTSNLLTQAQCLRHLYAWARALAQSPEDPAKLQEAATALENLLESRKSNESPPWQGWYTGDKKANLPTLLTRTRSAR